MRRRRLSLEHTVAVEVALVVLEEEQVHITGGGGGSGIQELITKYG